MIEIGSHIPTAGKDILIGKYNESLQGIIPISTEYLSNNPMALKIALSASVLAGLSYIYAWVFHTIRANALDYPKNTSKP